jgi:hypothetical protein
MSTQHVYSIFENVYPHLRQSSYSVTVYYTKTSLQAMPDAPLKYNKLELIAELKNGIPL